MADRSTICKECGCICKNCLDHSTLHLHVEIENLKQRLLERDHHIVNMETNFLNEADKFPNGEYAALSEELLAWQEKYSRLYEAHKKLQKVNQNLEDKLLKIVDKFETDKSSLTRDITHLTQNLVEGNAKITRLQDENERYRNDVNLAIQLLQCKPSNFVSQKFDSLPGELQQKVKTYMTQKKRETGGMQSKPEMKTIKVPIPTFPPTAMVYSVNKTPAERESSSSKSANDGIDIVSAAIMAKVLEERERERCQRRHCDTCQCVKQNDKNLLLTTNSSGEISTPTSGRGTSSRQNILLEGITPYKDWNTSSLHNPMVHDMRSPSLDIEGDRGWRQTPRENSFPNRAPDQKLRSLLPAETEI
ncbi:hypothetical protein J437_LFUL014034 [Ladona fulva]|uniref:Tight junction-associated protein 1 n=1 Tax=Ladona fulva TaxID=123851 RepID=A0A8K0KIX0_LADFU|nr:hypothetical protein J437_LFUL014034 [Ladona fulva]